MYLGAWRNALYDWEGGFGCSKVLSAYHIQGNAEGQAYLCHTSPLACLKVWEQYTILHYIVPCMLIFEKLHDRLSLKWPKVA